MRQLIKKIILNKKKVKIIGSCKNVSIKCKYGENIEITESTVFQKCSIGDYTYLNKCNIYSGNIGRFCSIGYGSTIGPAEHPLNKITTHPIIYNKNYSKYNKNLENIQIKFIQPNAPNIEDNVWIGCNSIILRGVSIGEGAVIAAGSIVTKDVPPYTLVGGIPAKKIRELKQVITFRGKNTDELGRCIVNYLRKQQAIHSLIK